MPICPPRSDPFECAICGKARPLQWQDPTQMDYPPVCWACEQYGWRLGPITRNPDMRLAKQVAALSGALAEEASRKIYEEARHG